MVRQERLKFRIPEFVRVAWVSAKAEKTWAPIIQECSNFFQHLERFNRTAIISVKPEDMIGKPYIALGRINIADSYQSGTTDFNSNQPWQYRCAVGAKAEELASAYIHEDWSVVGHILGYPDCCIEFFQKYWVDEQWFDTTYPMGGGPSISEANNILLRWVGIRLVSHLPCSFSCVQTARIGERNVNLAHQLGFHKEIAHIVELLSWPVEWSSLHGIAIITTPAFKIITASDALAIKASIKLEGGSYPKEAGSGLVFPFKSPDDPIENGFKDYETMNNAHSKIIDTVSVLKPKSVLDLGCGNGLLLRKMAALFNTFTHGVDNDMSKNPDSCMSIYDYQFDRDYDLVLVAEQRTQENPKAWEALLARIGEHAKHLCIYNYNTNDIYLAL